MNTDKLLARMTAQSSGPNPKEPGGGVAMYTAADISLIASSAPHMSFHALMVKCCHDPISLKVIYSWLRRVSVEDWFNNEENNQRTIQISQANKLISLAILAWDNPLAPDVKTTADIARSIGTAYGTFQTRYQRHYHYLVKELQYVEAVGRSALAGYMKQDE